MMKMYVDANRDYLWNVLFHMNIITPKDDVVALFFISTFDNSGNFGVHTLYSMNSELLTNGELG